MPACLRLLVSFIMTLMISSTAEIRALTEPPCTEDINHYSSLHGVSSSLTRAQSVLAECSPQNQESCRQAGGNIKVAQDMLYNLLQHCTVGSCRTYDLSKVSEYTKWMARLGKEFEEKSGMKLEANVNDLVNSVAYYASAELCSQEDLRRT